MRGDVHHRLDKLLHGPSVDRVREPLSFNKITYQDIRHLQHNIVATGCIFPFRKINPATSRLCTSVLYPSYNKDLEKAS